MCFGDKRRFGLGGSRAGVSETRISNVKSENGFYLRDIRPQGGFQIWNLNPDFMIFDWEIRKGIYKTVLVRWTVVFFLHIVRTPAFSPFLRTDFYIRFGCTKHKRKERK